MTQPPDETMAVWAEHDWPDPPAMRGYWTGLHVERRWRLVRISDGAGWPIAAAVVVIFASVYSLLWWAS